MNQNALQSFMAYTYKPAKRETHTLLLKVFKQTLLLYTLRIYIYIYALYIYQEFIILKHVFIHTVQDINVNKTYYGFGNVSLSANSMAPGIFRYHLQSSNRVFCTKLFQPHAYRTMQLYFRKLPFCVTFYCANAYYYHYITAPKTLALHYLYVGLFI